MGTLFPVVYFSRETLPKKKGKRALLGIYPGVEQVADPGLNKPRETSDRAAQLLPRGIVQLTVGHIFIGEAWQCKRLPLNSQPGNPFWLLGYKGSQKVKPTKHRLVGRGHLASKFKTFACQNNSPSLLQSHAALNQDPLACVVPDPNQCVPASWSQCLVPLPASLYESNQESKQWVHCHHGIVLPKKKDTFKTHLAKSTPCLSHVAPHKLKRAIGLDHLLEINGSYKGNSKVVLPLVKVGGD